MGMVRLCSPLGDIDRFYPNAQDSIMTGEDDQTTWPAKLVQLPNGYILFEASWVDHDHVWRAATDSRTFHTMDGFRVGTTIDELRQRRESLTINDPEGVLVLGLPRLGLHFMLDRESDGVLAALPDIPTPEQLPRTGTVALWLIGARCPNERLPN